MDINYDQFDVFPNANVNIWKTFVKALDDIDETKTLVSTDTWPQPIIIDSKYHNVIQIFGYREPPGILDLIDWCKINPHVKFYCLCDLYTYDLQLPDNLEFIEYRFHFIELVQLLKENTTVITSPKNKQYKYKFSSLTNRKKQMRAAITCKLLSHYASQCILSWHDFYSGSVDDELVSSLHTVFSELDWHLLNQTISLDSDDSGKSFAHASIDNDAYNASLVNFTNETFSFGAYYKLYNRPGPYISEKTWKPLLSGNIVIPVGQPNTYRYLNEKYHCNINYSFDTSFDTQIVDIDRIGDLLELIDHLADISLPDLVEQNIDVCCQIQQRLLEPDYIQLFHQLNEAQDQILLNKIHS